jgi:uncharacterized protein
MGEGELTGRRLEVIEVDECLDLLARRFLGRLAYVEDGTPRIIPLNYHLHEGSIHFRMDYGSVLDTINGQPVAFEVDAVDAEYHTGWSVVVTGRAEEIWEPQELERARDLPLRPWAPGDRAHYVRIQSTAISGRRIT